MIPYTQHPLHRHAKKEEGVLPSSLHLVGLSIIVPVAEQERNAPETRDSDERKDNSRQHRHISTDGLNKVELENADAAPVQRANQHEDERQTVEKAHT